MPLYFESRRKVLIISLACWLPLGSSQACGPDFPYRLLDDRSNALDELPEGNFAFEASRLSHSIQGLGQAGDGTLRAYWDNDNQQYLEARTAVERQQLSAVQLALVEHLRSLTDAQQAETEGNALPAELREYTAGAVAFAQYEDEVAAGYFRRVLALPLAERPLRSTWAAYSLGRSLSRLAGSAAESDLSAEEVADRSRLLQAQASEAFQLARNLSSQGFSDPLELGIASLGEEAYLAKLNNDWGTAIRLYASQLRHGSDTGYSSLRQLARELQQMPTEQLLPLLQLREVQQLLTAHLFSRLDAFDPLPKTTADLIGLLQSPQIVRLENADRLAALSYQRGDYEIAQRFLDQTEDSGLAWWLRAKLALRAGDKAAAMTAYANAAKAFPAEEDWGFQRNENWRYESVKPRCRVEGEMAILALERGEYLEAFDQLYRSGDIYWMDAATVAERVLSTDELIDYVERNVPAAATDPQRSEWERPVATRLRELLGRRLLREQRYAQAVPYFASAELQKVARDYGEARLQAENAWSDIDRAQGYYRAATLAREQGLELLGYELAPDNAWAGGNFGTDLLQPLQPSGLLTASEASLQNASAPVPNRRFHYRWVAADLANRAADFLPPRSQAFAAALCNASGWVNYRDLASAQGYYRRYVQQGPYVDWAYNFGFNCQEPDFAGAEQRLWFEREQRLRNALRPYKYWLPLGVGTLLIAAIYWRRKRANR
nr:hypothetical protein [uncultured Pseudomonas sp.]